MQPTRNIPKKAPKFMDAKIFIAAASIAVTIGLWNFFSHAAVLEAMASQQTVEEAPVEPPVAGDQGLPPLPTLVPLVEVETVQQNAGVPSNQVQFQQNPPTLRSVTAPDQVIVQKGKPVFDDPGAIVITVGGGGGRSSGPAPVTRARRS